MGNKGVQPLVLTENTTQPVVLRGEIQTAYWKKKREKTTTSWNE
jgi:hypothetical protein